MREVPKVSNFYAPRPNVLTNILHSEIYLAEGFALLKLGKGLIMTSGMLDQTEDLSRLNLGDGIIHELPKSEEPPEFSGDDDSIIAYFDMHDLTVLGYMYSDALNANGANQGVVTVTREHCALDYIKLKNHFRLGSKNRYFINEYLLIAQTYAHYIRSARRKLEEERALCADKRNKAMEIETSNSWFALLLKLSGQLVLIGGLVGIISWFVIGEAKVAGNETHQTLMAIAFAFGSMIFAMATQGRSMTAAQRNINQTYHEALDVAKEKQAKSLADGLKRTRDRFEILLKKRFGDSADISRKLNIDAEMAIFEELKHVDNPHDGPSLLRRFWNWLTGRRRSTC